MFPSFDYNTFPYMLVRLPFSLNLLDFRSNDVGIVVRSDAVTVAGAQRLVFVDDYEFIFDGEE